ncbi:hypothetical protein I7X10_16530 [Bacillus halotolerans]|uniref:hypothetical protein n=1 Tax=Bacillus halotolerans TaxID=260554 RepID=UPI0018DD86D1|nr:hypothetical protein [Bacillus halotolerans]QPZ41507.1 hypothetical protein I7X10_16530 [Bacillus halotolerans]
MQILNGVYMEGQELQEFKERAFNDSSFDDLLVVVNQQFNNEQTVSKKDLKVDKGYKSDIELEEGYVVSGKQIVFINEPKTVRIAYYELNDYELPIEYKEVAQVLTTDKTDSHYLLGITFNTEGEIEIDTLSVDYPESQLPDITEPLPNDPNYIPQDTGNFMDSGEETSGDFTTKVWWTSNGCLPGGYQHCGGNCGYNGDHGGGKPINYTDSCCVLHDRCYGKGLRKCKCDTMLVECVRNEVTWAAFGIRMYFGPKGC